MHDLTGFKRDILRTVAVLGDEPSGLDIKEEMEEKYGYPEIHHGRLYPNLDDLVTKGLLEKGQQDRRTNWYSLSRRGKREIESYVDDWEEAAEQIETEVAKP